MVVVLKDDWPIDLKVEEDSNGVAAMRRVDEGGPAAAAERAADKVRRGAGVQKGARLMPAGLCTLGMGSCFALAACSVLEEEEEEEEGARS